MRPRAPRLPATVAALLFATLLSCTGDRASDAPAAGEAAVGEDGPQAEGVVDDPSGRVLRLRETGPGDELPTAFTVTLRKPLFREDQVGMVAPEGNTLVFSPPVEGELRVTDRDTLTFTPTTGFQPATSYTVRFASLSSDEGRFDAPVVDGENPWNRSFETPEFGLARLSVNARDIKKQTLVVDLVFTGPVDPSEVSRRLSMKLDGARVQPATVLSGPRSSVVRVSIAGRAVLDEGKLDVALSPGLPLATPAGISAGALSGQLDIAAGQPIHIEAMVVKEGVNGHYVEVVCNDPAAGGERWYWDQDSYDGWWVSSRCMPLGDNAARMLHVDPDLEFTVAEAPAGFRIFGDFGQGSYTIGIDAGLATLDGGVLTEAWTSTLRVPERSPSVGFSTKGRYLPRSAWRNLPLRHLNVQTATLTVRHVPEENLVFWLSGDEALSPRTANVVLEKELALGGVVDEEATTWLDVGSLLPQVERGIYELELKQKEGSARDAARLLLTDLQLVAKQAAPKAGAPYSTQTLVWALDAHTAAPVSGTEISLVRPSGQVLTRCRTDLDGACTLSAPDPGVDKTPPLAILARKGSDLTYLKFEDLQVQADADTTGAPWTRADDGAAAGYTAAVWTDRGVYRPGETAHLAAMLRADDFRAPKDAVPALVKLHDPQGKEIRRKLVQTDATGVITLDLPFADFATTGSYRAVVEVAERTVGSASFNVEEFVPERMEVKASADPEGRRFTDAVPVSVEARWLFGGSAEGSPYEVDCRVEAAPFVPKENSAYHFGLADLGDRRVRPLSLGQQEGRLGVDGKVTATCPAANRGGASLGAARLVADVSVFEGDSGRTTRAVATAPLHPDAYYLGTRANLDKLKAGQTLTVDGVVVDWGGKISPKLAPKEVSVEVFRLEEEFGWWWDDEDESSSYRRLLRRVSESTSTVPVDQGKFQVALTPKYDAAGWVVVVSAGETLTEQAVDGEGRRYWWDPSSSSVDQTPRPRRPTALSLDLPEQIQVGQRVEVAFKAPYAGRALMAVETDRVVRWEWLDVKAGQSTWSFQVDAFSPNAYVSAFLIKDPHLESAEAYLPDRAYGVKSVRIEPQAFVHSVSLDLPKEIRPYSELAVGLQVNGPDGKPVTGTVTATVAVVDEGVLSLTKFETPDPTRQIFAKRMLGVDSFETVGWTLLMKPRGPSSRTGGDGMGAGGRVQMVKPVALWSGPVQVQNGRATVKFDVPGYRGKLRVMAVAASAERMGHAEGNVVVRDPIVIQSTLPRFLVSGDIAQIPVFVSNMSGKAQDITVNLEIEDFETNRMVQVQRPRPVVDHLGEKQGHLSLADGASGTVVFQVTASRAPAAARFRVTAKAGSLVSKEEIELPVMPLLPEDRRAIRVPVGSDAIDLDAMVASAGWLPGADRTTYWLTTNPYAQALTHLRALVRYPYGCIEQTSSSTRPLLYVANLVEFIDPSLVQDTKIEDMVRHGIDRVLSMQTPSGGFGYWPGSSHPSEWGSAYGTHMLIDAREAGFEVPERALTDALNWLENQVQGSDGNPDGAEAYAAYVLARAGRAQPARAQQLIERLDQVDVKKHSGRGLGWELEARYLLMASMYLGGDHRYESELKGLDTSELSWTRSNSWAFYSDLRRRSLMLAVYTDVFGLPKGADPGAALADLVASSLERSSSRYTTQEMAWGVTALGKRALSASAKAPAATVTLAGKVLEPGLTGKGGDRSWTIQGATATDSLTMALPSDAKAWLIATTEGVRAKDDLPTGGNGLRVSRAWLTANGQPLDLSRHTLGDTVFVKVVLENLTSSAVRNVALVDRLPAGWEIENPRLGRGALPEWVDADALWNVDHMNLRDDRVELFGEIPSKASKTLIYQVRAVTSGSFAVPEIRAEAMYDPELWARETGRPIDIQGPWDSFLL